MVRKDDDTRRTDTRERRNLEPGHARCTLLNGFTLVSDGEEVYLPHSAQRLLAFFALRPHPASRAYVAGHLWPDRSQDRSSGNLRSALWRLRHSKLPLVVGTRIHLWLASTVSVDVRDVAATVGRLLDRSVPCLPEDLNPALLTGELLPDWYEDEWVLVEREHLLQLCIHGLEAQCERLLAMGKHRKALEAGLALVRRAPLRDSAQFALMSVHLAMGNSAEAIHQYRAYRTLLRDELGVEPSPQTTQLLIEIDALRCLT